MEQNFLEFAWMLRNYVADKKSILEIGSRYGCSLTMMAFVAKPGAALSAIDCVDVGLITSISYLCANGFDARYHIGDSHSEAALKFARDRGPYDFVFIDGDHTYEGAKQDWKWYGPLGKAVALHDIKDTPLGVPRLWAEIKATHRTQEYAVHNNILGIGVVERV